jgi:hypothetical protein
VWRLQGMLALPRWYVPEIVRPCGGLVTCCPDPWRRRSNQSCCENLTSRCFRISGDAKLASGGGGRGAC